MAPPRVLPATTGGVSWDLSQGAGGEGVRGQAALGSQRPTLQGRQVSCPPQQGSEHPQVVTVCQVPRALVWGLDLGSWRDW